MIFQQFQASWAVPKLRSVANFSTEILEIYVYNPRADKLLPAIPGASFALNAGLIYGAGRKKCVTFSLSFLPAHLNNSGLNLSLKRRQRDIRIWRWTL